jgi:predicted oxidoreductase
LRAIASPQDGVRLIRAFVRIKDAALRQKIIDMVEEAAEVGQALVDRADLVQFGNVEL